MRLSLNALQYLSAVVLVTSASKMMASEVPTPTPTTFPQCEFSPQPSSGTAATTISLQGVCYPIHSGRLGFIYWDDREVAQVRGDTPGHYTAEISIPQGSAPGAHRLELRLEPDCCAAAHATFTLRDSGPCRGDCDGDGQLTISEVMGAVNPALALCPLVGDAEGETARLQPQLRAVYRALVGCPAQGSCRKHQDCPQLRCLEPGESLGCGICHDVEDECLNDSECGAGDHVCVRHSAAELCTCRSIRVCEPGCSAANPCATGMSCTAGHCLPQPCIADGQCGPYFWCEQLVEGKACFRKPCVDDGGCAGGFCVNSRCYGNLGTCSAYPP